MPRFSVEGLDENISEIDPSSFEQMIARALKEFPNFKITATTLRVEGMQGSVLFRLQQTARPTLGPGDDRVSVPLRVRWGRCDEHAISESSQTFLWKLDISVDGREPVRITTTVDDADKAPLLGYLKKACA